MRVLQIGDIVGKIGRNAVVGLLPRIIKEQGVDFVVANADNLAHGGGITKKTINILLENGVDVVTNGDHIWDKNEAIEVLGDQKKPVLRPVNYPEGTPGVGEKIFEKNGEKILVINLQGNVFMRSNLSCPFRSMDDVLQKYKEEELVAILVDFHAEATSEKVAMKCYLDGRVSALCGTHTHVPTADFQVTKKGTAYISDLGMVGPMEGVIGVKKEIIISKFLTQRPMLHEVSEGDVEFNAVLIDLDNETGKAKSIIQIREIITA